MRNIIQKDNKILRASAKPVADATSKEIKKIISFMAEAMFKEPDGIGIAAPQVGENLRIFLIAKDVLTPEKLNDPDYIKNRSREYLLFINPVLKKHSAKKSKDLEGCLSVRGEYGEVTRPEKVTVEYFDEHGKKRTRGASRLLARVIQHEIDHLNGVLFTDKAKNLRKLTQL